LKARFIILYLYTIIIYAATVLMSSIEDQVLMDPHKILYCMSLRGNT